MKGIHARKAPVPFWMLIAALVVVAGSVADVKRRILIHGAGDVSLDPGYISTFVSQGYGYAWSGLGGLFRRDDLTIVNVECPVTDRGEQLS